MTVITELTILIPVDVSETELPNLEVLDQLRPFEVVLLGYFPVPDQAEPALIKHEYEDEALERLDAIAAGRGNLTDILVFTHDRRDTIDRIADEYDCDVVYSAGRTEEIRRVLVPIRGDANLDRITSVVAVILQGFEASATLLHAADGDGDTTEEEEFLAGIVGRFTDLGIEEDRIDWEITPQDPQSAIVEMASDYDLVVLGETEPSLRERIMGELLVGIVRKLEVPSLIVRDIE